MHEQEGKRPSITTGDEFMCPQCGSSYFGTHMKGEPDTWTGYCNGDGEDYVRTCLFTWPRTDDWKYFVELTRTPYASAEEFAKRYDHLKGVTYKATTA